MQYLKNLVFEPSSWELSHFTPICRNQETLGFASSEFLLQLMKNLRLPCSEDRTDKHLLINSVLTSDDKHGLANYFFSSSQLLISVIIIL